ncbi:MAG TPA: hypothetical protein VJ933_13230, partial [Phaeodactylibacter sp.]|nr:hypothetical protein [Phaeodactylibacter sp.]
MTTNNNPNISDQILEQVDTVSDAMRNIGGVQDVDIATAPREIVWEDGKVKLYRFSQEEPAVA